MQPEESAPVAGGDDGKLRAIRRQGRLAGLALLCIAAATWAFVYCTIHWNQTFSPNLVILGTATLILGIAALVEPRLIWASGRERHLAPRALRIGVIVVALVATGAGIALAEWLGR
jgi:hypothetical protein